MISGASTWLMYHCAFTPFPQTSDEANSAPDHDARTSPCVVLQDVVGSIHLVEPSPHSDTSVGLAGAVSTFVRKEDVLPLSPVPVQVLLCQLQSLLLMSYCQHWTSYWTPTTQVSLGQPPPYGVATNRGVVVADDVSSRLGKRE